jgi:hypothetical protein
MATKKKTTESYLAGYIPAKNNIDPYQPATSLKNLNLSYYSFNSQQIGAQAGAVDTTATIYTVPKGYTLFITSINLEIIKQVTSIVYARGKFLLNQQVIMRLYAPLTEGENTCLGFNFSEPYILHQGETVQVTSENADGLAQAGFTGALIKNEDIIF